MKKPPNTIIITAERTFEIEKPRYNAHQTGTGAHRSKKDYRRKPKHRYGKDDE